MRCFWHYGVLVAIIALIALGYLAPVTAQASHDTGPDRVYFPQTGHTLQGGFLNHWRHHGGLPIYGYPVSEEFPNPETGVITQFFERAVFEWHPDNPDDWKVLLYRLGANMSEGREKEAPFQRLPAADNPNCTYYDATGHFLCNGFKKYWETYGGLPTFGYPLSEEFTEKNRDTGQTYIVQYFERARFEWHPENAGTVYEVLLGRLGAQAADEARIDTSRIPQPEGVQTYDPSLFVVPTPPAPAPETQVTPPEGAPTWVDQWIEVDLSEQYMRAWEYDQVVNGTYVSTGTADYPTPTGTFWVFYKLRYDDMTNGLAAPPGEYYYVEDVPHVMYFADGGYAIHGAYWHNMFGTPYSHGCVSTPLAKAEWFYNWAPTGTRVWIHW